MAVENKTFKAMQILHTAMLAGMVVFCLVSAVTLLRTKHAANPAFNKTLQVIALVVAFGCCWAAFRIFNRKLEEMASLSTVDEKLDAYRSASIIKWALIEVPVVVAVISFMVTRNYAFIGLAFALMILFAFQGPVKQKIMLQLNLTESDMLDQSK